MFSLTFCISCILTVACNCREAWGGNVASKVRWGNRLRNYLRLLFRLKRLITPRNVWLRRVFYPTLWLLVQRCCSGGKHIELFTLLQKPHEHRGGLQGRGASDTPHAPGKKRRRREREGALCLPSTLGKERERERESICGSCPRANQRTSEKGFKLFGGCFGL